MGTFRLPALLRLRSQPVPRTLWLYASSGYIFFLFMGSDRTGRAVAYPLGSHLPAVSVASSLASCSARTVGDSLPAPLLPEPREAARVSLALPRRGSRRQCKHQLDIVLLSKRCKKVSHLCQPTVLVLCPRQRCSDPQSWVLLGPFGHSPCSPHISARCPCPTALPVLPPNYPQSCLSLGLARLGEEGEALDPGARRPTTGLWHCSTIEGDFFSFKTWLVQRELCHTATIQLV